MPSGSQFVVNATCYYLLCRRDEEKRSLIVHSCASIAIITHAGFITGADGPVMRQEKDSVSQNIQITYINTYYAHHERQWQHIR